MESKILEEEREKRFLEEIVKQLKRERKRIYNNYYKKKETQQFAVKAADSNDATQNAVASEIPDKSGSVQKIPTLQQEANDQRNLQNKAISPMNLFVELDANIYKSGANISNDLVQKFHSMSLSPPIFYKQTSNKAESYSYNIFTCENCGWTFDDCMKFRRHESYRLHKYDEITTYPDEYYCSIIYKQRMQRQSCEDGEEAYGYLEIPDYHFKAYGRESIQMKAKKSQKKRDPMLITRKRQILEKLSVNVGVNSDASLEDSSMENDYFSSFKSPEAKMHVYDGYCWQPIHREEFFNRNEIERQRINAYVPQPLSLMHLSRMAAAPFYLTQERRTILTETNLHYFPLEHRYPYYMFPSHRK